MADIFISYASEDRERIEPLVQALEGEGYSVWWDRELVGGSFFSEEIEKELEGASAVIVAWSGISARSRWVADEAEAALEQKKLVPIGLDGTRAPMGFRQLQTIDFSEWEALSAPCFDRLLQALSLQLTGAAPKPPERESKSASEAKEAAKLAASIAVLPFVNMSPDPEQEYFADGISEELLNLLAKIKELTVIARTSSFAFKGTDKSIAEIGSILRVAHVLEGSVRKAGNRIRITAQLIKVEDASHLWSETFDRDLDDIFAIQDEISAAIVKELKPLILGGQTMTAPQADRTEDIEAYEHYLLGHQRLNARTRQDIEKGKEHFEKALRRDPGFAPALVGLADTHLLLSDSWTCYGTTPISEACAAAEPLLAKALELDDGLAEAHGVYSVLHWLKDDLEACQREAERALELSPNYSRGHSMLAWAYTGLGDPRAPLVSIEAKAVECNPAAPLTLIGLAGEYFTRLRFDKIAAIKRRIEAINADSHWLTFARASEHKYKGEFKSSLKTLLASDVAFLDGLLTRNIFQLAFTLGHGSPFERRDPVSALEIYSSQGRTEDARRVVSLLGFNDSSIEDYEDAQVLALYRTAEGQFKEALALMEPYDETAPGRYGRHFDRDCACHGALLSIHLRQQLGITKEAEEHLVKLREVCDALSEDPDGQYLGLDTLKGYVALAGGDRDECLTCLERQVERSIYGAVELLHSPVFTPLQGEARYEALISKVRCHVESERLTAEKEGLLPIPQNLLDRLEEE